jgi:hypothetical protein
MEIACASTDTDTDIDCDIDIMELTSIRDKIETMTKFNQVEILRVLSKHKSVILNENKYGVHVNLTELSTEIINELKVYINYVNTQEINLNCIEQQKENFKNTYFTKDNKDNNIKLNSTTAYASTS